MHFGSWDSLWSHRARVEILWSGHETSSISSCIWVFSLQLVIQFKMVMKPWGVRALQKYFPGIGLNPLIAWTQFLFSLWTSYLQIKCDQLFLSTRLSSHSYSHALTTVVDTVSSLGTTSQTNPFFMNFLYVGVYYNYRNVTNIGELKRFPEHNYGQIIGRMIILVWNREPNMYLVHKLKQHWQMAKIKMIRIINIRNIRN